MHKTSQKEKLNTEALCMLCPCSLILLTIHTESQMQALGLCFGDLYSEGYLRYFTGGHILERAYI